MDETTKDRTVDELHAILKLPKRNKFYHRSHTGNIDDGEGSTMQTQSPDDRLSVDRSC